jgi:hypothetical protein
MRASSSRLEPMMEDSPRLAAVHASKSLASSSRTWFSTGININGLFNVILWQVSFLAFMPLITAAFYPHPSKLYKNLKLP